MKVVLASPVSCIANGGTAAYFRNLGNELVSRGHDVCGISRIRAQQSLNLQYWNTDVVRNDIKSQTICLDGWTNRIVFPHAAMSICLRIVSRLLWRPRFQSLAIGLFNRSYRNGFMSALPKDVDVLHYIGTGAELFGFTAQTLAKEVGAKCSVTPFVHPGEWGDGSIDIRFYNIFDSVFACTDLERKHLTQTGVEDSKLVRTPMAPSGVLSADPGRFRRQYDIEHRPIILFLARKQRYKGYHALCESMNRVVSKIPNVLLVVAGPDGELPYPTVSPLNFLDLGELTSSDEHRQIKADALGACDVFCMPSMAEAFGLVYAEAWAYGKPVVGGLAPALSELISDGVDGYIVSQDPATIADRLVELLMDEPKRKAMGSRGLEKQSKLYTWEAVLNSHCEVWNYQN